MFFEIVSIDDEDNGLIVEDYVNKWKLLQMLLQMDIDRYGFVKVDREMRVEC